MIELAIFLVLLISGFVFGRLAERRHFKSILRREKETLAVPVMTVKSVPAGLTRCKTFLVSGNIVVSIDFFKKFLSGLKAMIGGAINEL